MTAGSGNGRAGHGGTIADDEIVRFLQTRPDFLARHPSLYLTLAPPARVHGEQVADHMAAMLGAARQQNRQLQDSVRDRRAGRSFGARVEQALIGLIRAAEPVEWVHHELAATLGLDTAQVHLKGGGAGGGPGGSGGLVVSAELARRLLGRRDVVFREVVTDGAALHGAAAGLVRHDVLVRLRPDFGPAGLLALGGRDGLPGPGTEAALALLASGLQAALERG